MNEKPEKSIKAKLTEKIKSVSNILVTVSRNSSVDQLAAALGLTFALDKLGKHATAVFSGAIPPAINFLEPEKTFENNADSLRDFIISLDKEKADRLRYKVEGDLVKVFITPYKTKISESDLTFSEGEFNVELVVALGVESKEELDEAISAHGRIFHDATVATININSGKDVLGVISWQDAAASSLSELVADLVENLVAKDKPLLDEQIATALLTGVVAATDQFRNEKTSPNVMTLAANLMAKGANQQLIASELAATAEEENSSEAKQPETDIVVPKQPESHNEMSVSHDEPPPPEEPEKTIPETIPAPPQATESNLPLTGDLIAVENKKFAEQRSDDALAAATAQLTEAQLNIEKPTLLPASTPTQTSTPDVTEAALDTVVAQNNTSNLSHGTPYVEESITMPLNAAMTNSEPPLTDPLSSAQPSSDANRVVQPPPTAPMISNNAPPTVPSIPLPPPPPLTAPEVGQLPPVAPPPESVPNGLPPVPPMTPKQPTPAPMTPSSTSPMFPSVDTTPDPNDPTQYQIPG